MTIEKALPKDAEEIFEIYEALKGSPGCPWNEEYPSLEFVCDDIEKRCSLYKAAENGKIIAAAYLGDFEENERPDCLDKSMRFAELSRVGVRREYQRKGIASVLLRHLLSEAELLGYDGIALLVGTENHPAMALYEKFGFERCGETQLYGIYFYCYQYKV